MFIHNQIIDAVQASKKQFVSTFVTDSKFKEELVKLIDSQTDAAKTSVEASLAIAQSFVKNAQESFKAFVPATK